MKNTVKTKRRKTTTRVLALVIALITALSAMSAISFSASAASNEITYNVNFDLWGHATQDVCIKINGSNGSTDWYNAGSIGHYSDHYFSFKGKDVGEIESISIKQEMNGCLIDGPVNQYLYLNSWAFKSVTINGTKIYGGRFITDLEEHTFSVTDNVYRVKIQTADEKNAGTDLNVYVTLNGTDGSKSNTVNMSENGYDTTGDGIYINAFERGHEQTTYIYAPFDTLESITIELDGLLFAAKGWKCQSITIEQMQGGTDTGVKTINVNQWFATEDNNYSRTFTVPLNQDETGKFLVDDYNDLCRVADMVNSGNSDYVNGSYILTNDIDCKNEDWTKREMIGTNNIEFNGTFDGQNHTIRNLNYGADVEGNDSGKVQGLFAILGNDATVKNLTVENATVWSDDSMVKGSAVIAKQNNGRIENCTVRNSKVQLGNSDYLGGIAGLNNGTIENCYVEGTTLMRRWGGCGDKAMGNICEVNNGTVKSCSACGCRFANGSVIDNRILVASGNEPV